MPSNWLLWDRIRALAQANRIYQVDRNFQDQSQLDRIVAGGEFLDWSVQAAILDQTNLHINRLQRYRDYEQMDQVGEITLALDLFADESTLFDPERKHTLIIKAKSKRIKRELEELFFGTLQWDSQARPATRYVCKFGDSPFEIVPNKNRDGVSALRHMNVYNFTRVETRYGDLVGFFFQDDLLPEPIFMHPWQVMHLRLTTLENIFAPYGRAVLDGGRKAFKQLRLMEDAALIYRITRSAEKRKFKIPVGNIPVKEIPEYLEAMGRRLKRQRFYNPQTDTFDERYSPLIQEDDFFLPVRSDGTGPDIDIIPGGQNLDDIKDIEYFKKKMIAPMKIPFARVGIGEGAGEAFDKSVSASHSDFAKAVQYIQREMAAGLTKVAIVHLALRGFPLQDIKDFELVMPASSAIEELYRIETWQTRVQVMSDLKELGWFPKEWIVTHFTDLTPDEILELKEMEEMAVYRGIGETGSNEEGGGGLGGLGGGPAPGGELGGEPGLEDIGGAGGPPPGGAPPGGPPPAGEEEEEEEKPAVGERFDIAAERRILMELSKRGNKKAILELLDRWAVRLGRSRTRETTESVNHCQYLLEHKELDGLTKAIPPPSTDLAKYDPNGAPGLLVEWSAPEVDRELAITEARDLLVAGWNEVRKRGDAGDEVIEDGEVTEDDLPGPGTNGKHVRTPAR